MSDLVLDEGGAADGPKLRRSRAGVGLALRALLVCAGYYLGSLLGYALICPNVFKSFYTTKENGMGLGLAIARSIIEVHGGRIWASNNPGGGAIFSFTLPTTTGQGTPDIS